jgi:hypothetical protein
VPLLRTVDHKNGKAAAKLVAYVLAFGHATNDKPVCSHVDVINSNLGLVNVINSNLGLVNVINSNPDLVDVISAFLHPGKVTHIRRVFESLVVPAAPARIWIVGHWLGGVVLEVLRGRPAWTIAHVKAIAMTDGYETAIAAAGFQINKWCHEQAINWVCSAADVNAQLPDGPSGGIARPGRRTIPCRRTWHSSTSGSFSTKGPEYRARARRIMSARKGSHSPCLIAA